MKPRASGFTHALTPAAPPRSVRVATYNIHKGVRGVGPTKRLEIHNLSAAVASLSADVICLQEVRLFHERDARRFRGGRLGWPELGQADFLAPDGFDVAYRSNAVTRHGEHGNAVLSRWPLAFEGHHDVSDHRFEQRGLLHTSFEGLGQRIHVIVAHFALLHVSRLRQVQRLVQVINREVPADEPVLVAGDFNDWSERLDGPMADAGLLRARPPQAGASMATFPALVPVFALDRFYLRGLRCLSTEVPRGAGWRRWSDHLPLVAELALA